MEHKGKSIRPFLGAKDYKVSRNFYVDLGFQESVIDNSMSYFFSDKLGFYLQKSYVKDWVDNTMVFMEVDDVERFWKELRELDLDKKYRGTSVKLTPIRTLDWGKECFVHDPSGILWHFGEFF